MNEPLPALDPLIHSRVRLGILSILIGVKEADFVYLKNATSTTDGNLSTNLTRLEEGGLIRIRKTFKDKKPRTTVSITDRGRKSFAEYLNALESILPREGK